MKKIIKFSETPVILRITGSGIPPPHSTLFYPGNSPDNGDPLITRLFTAGFAKISRWNIRRTVFQYFKKPIASTENQNLPIAVPVGLIFLLG